MPKASAKFDNTVVFFCEEPTTNSILNMDDRVLAIYHILLQAYGYSQKWFGETPDEIIIGAFLVQNTNWLNVEKALANLRTARLLSLQALSQLSSEELIPHIRPAGFHHQKAPRLISIAKSLLAIQIEQFVSGISHPGTLDNTILSDNEPSTLRNYLLSLKGLGPETTDCIMLYVCGFEYFVIDAYSIRIFSRLGLCEPSVKYHTLQEWFTRNLPQDNQIYREYHSLLIKLAKTACFKQPRCSICPLQSLCAYAKVNHPKD